MKNISHQEFSEAAVAAVESDYEKETGASYTDSLTGLFNHGFFQVSLDREIKRYERYGTPFTLAIVDIDSFFFYNHRHGHLHGDRTLKKIADLIKANIRDTDLAARFGGDVFAILLPEADVNDAFKPLDRIRNNVSELEGPPVTISIGVAGYPRDAVNKSGIVQRANAALEEAKTRGKNCVYFFEDTPDAADDAKPVILVVDDDPRNVKLLEALLTQQQLSPIKAFNGKDALHILTKTDVDVVLLDIMMPGIDGYEVCRRIKGNPATRMIPVVLVTALDDMDSKIKGIEAGADDFITKPVNKLELLARTKSLINVKKLN